MARRVRMLHTIVPLDELQAMLELLRSHAAHMKNRQSTMETISCNELFELGADHEFSHCAHKLKRVRRRYNESLDRATDAGITAMLHKWEEEEEVETFHEQKYHEKFLPIGFQLHSAVQAAISALLLELGN